MADTVVTTNAPARPTSGLITLAGVPCVFTCTATVYATATGGMPVDIATLLNNAGPYDSGIHPSDIIGFIGTASTGHLVGAFTVGTPTYNVTTDSSFRTKLSLATCPCAFRLWVGTPAEIAEGAQTVTVTGMILVARGGRN